MAPWQCPPRRCSPKHLPKTSAQTLNLTYSGPTLEPSSLIPQLLACISTDPKSNREETSQHLQAVRHVLRDDALREALHDGGLADASLADDARVVLRAPRQDLDGAPVQRQTYLGVSTLI